MSEEMRCAEGYDCPEGPDGACCGNPRLETYATRQAPKVKPLEWGALSTPEWEKAGIAIRIAKTFFGEYLIRSIPRNGEHIWNGPFSPPESCADYVDAKAAAIADYTLRILSVLEE